jgi:osmotically-inducible protein OsmY
MMATMVKRDVAIQQDVLAELAFDPQVEPTDVGVEVDDGVVTLTGTVEKYVERWAAEHAASRVIGVRALANEIVVKREGVGLPDDTEIAKGVADAFARNVLIPTAIDIRVSHGGVTLDGKVQWQYQRTAAEHVAQATRGVKWVSNLIEVAQPPVSTHEIETGIKHAMVRNAAVDADRVHVAVSGGHVTLTGTVRSYAERREAQDAAWRAKGVTAVTNTIAVQQ